MRSKRTTTDALEILNRVVLKNDPERLRRVEHYRLNFEAASLIYNLRNQAGLSQAELAKRIDTTQSVISRLEDADYNGHSLNMLAKIAIALNYHLVISAEKLSLSKSKSNSKIIKRTKKRA